MTNLEFQTKLYEWCSYLSYVDEPEDFVCGGMVARTYIKEELQKILENIYPSLSEDELENIMSSL